MSQHTELRLELTKNLKWNGLLGVWLIKHHELIGLIERAADALQAMDRVPMTWQSIDTAPKDGTNVLLCFPGLGWVRGSWDSQIHHKKPKPYWTHDCIQYMGVAHARANQPNWWMPLPTPPESI